MTAEHIHDRQSTLYTGGPDELAVSLHILPRIEIRVVVTAVPAKAIIHESLSVLGPCA